MVARSERGESGLSVRCRDCGSECRAHDLLDHDATTTHGLLLYGGDQFRDHSKTDYFSPQMLVDNAMVSTYSNTMAPSPKMSCQCEGGAGNFTLSSSSSSRLEPVAEAMPAVVIVDVQGIKVKTLLL